MKASIEWLSEYTKIDISSKELAHRLTLSGSKVEEVFSLGEEIDGVYIGQIAGIEKHPDADALVVCQVDFLNYTSFEGVELVKEENGLVQIVTAAKNIAVGDLVPVALPGSKLAGGLKIKKGKLRGVASNGMFCSIAELGLNKDQIAGAPENGIFIFPKGTAIGLSVRDYFSFGNEILDFEITNNRADCFSIRGLAKETALTLEQEYFDRKATVLAHSKELTKDYVSVFNEAPKLCSKYFLRLVTDVKVQISPEWLQRRLREHGIRPINNMVDITNYVLLELGQPMHAFDYETIEGKEIHIRNAQPQEQVKTLDGVERTLSEEMLVISDKAKAVAVAGIMGLENSEITEQTKTVVFEAANFSADSVRKSSQTLGLKSESSDRFEKGLDPNLAIRAIERACELVEQLGIGTVAKDTLSADGQNLGLAAIPYRPEKINLVLGTNLEEPVIRKYLEALGCEFLTKEKYENYLNEDLLWLTESYEAKRGILPDDASTWVLPPKDRRDLISSADLAEEVGRFYGYNTIIPRLPDSAAMTFGAFSERQRFSRALKSFAVAKGFREAISLSFESPNAVNLLNLDEADERREAVSLRAAAQEISAMRTSLLPSLLSLVSLNVKRDQKEGSLFEMARTYFNKKNEEGLPTEKESFAIALWSESKDAKQGSLFYRLKDFVESLSVHLGFSEKILFERIESNNYLHPWRSATFYIMKNNEKVQLGEFGYLHPSIAKNSFDLDLSVAILDLKLESFLDFASFSRKQKALPKFPAYRRDLGLLADADLPVGDLITLFEKEGGPYFESVKLFDIFQDARLGENKKSIAFALTFRHPERTLEEKDVKERIEHLLKRAEELYQAVLRL